MTDANISLYSLSSLLEIEFKKPAENPIQRHLGLAIPRRS